LEIVEFLAFLYGSVVKYYSGLRDRLLSFLRLFVSSVREKPVEEIRNMDWSGTGLIDSVQAYYALYQKYVFSIKKLDTIVTRARMGLDFLHKHSGKVEGVVKIYRTYCIVKAIRKGDKQEILNALTPLIVNGMTASLYPILLATFPHLAVVPYFITNIAFSAAVSTMLSRVVSNVMTTVPVTTGESRLIGISSSNIGALPGTGAGTGAGVSMLPAVLPVGIITKYTRDLFESEQWIQKIHAFYAFVLGILSKGDTYFRDVPRPLIVSSTPDDMIYLSTLLYGRDVMERVVVMMDVGMHFKNDFDLIADVLSRPSSVNIRALKGILNISLFDAMKVQSGVNRILALVGDALRGESEEDRYTFVLLAIVMLMSQTLLFRIDEYFKRIVDFKKIKVLPGSGAGGRRRRRTSKTKTKNKRRRTRRCPK
jgi:hypothetical protein